MGSSASRQDEQTAACQDQSRQAGADNGTGYSSCCLGGCVALGSLRAYIPNLFDPSIALRVIETESPCLTMPGALS